MAFERNREVTRVTKLNGNGEKIERWVGKQAK